MFYDRNPHTEDTTVLDEAEPDRSHLAVHFTAACRVPEGYSQTYSLYVRNPQWRNRPVGLWGRDALPARRRPVDLERIVNRAACRDAGARGVLDVEQ